MSPTMIEQQWMDRLVDGELNESERLELLSRLELEPGAWKRCAVTFLEAQMWQSSFRAARANRDDRTLMPSATSPSGVHHRFVPPVVYAAIAASLLTAFTLGWSLGGRQASSAFTTEMAGNATGGGKSLAPDGQWESQGAVNRPNESERSGLPEGSASASDSALAKGASSAGRPVNLVGPETSQAKLGNDGKAEKEVARAGLALPVVRAWERRGFHIEKEPQVVSMTTKDGRKVAVPVDAVRLRFIGDRIY